MYKINLLLIPIVFLLLSCNGFDKRQSTAEDALNGLVVKIVDGDTFYFDDGSSKGKKVRLIGVDAPESKKTFKKEVGAFGKEAKEYLTDLLEGQKVKLEYDVDHLDQYGRTLAYVYMEDGTFVNAELVKSGFAMVMTVPPNVKFADVFLELQQEARENNRGLWRLQD